ncbi:MAG: sulfatase [Acidobacteriota bacterium]
MVFAVGAGFCLFLLGSHFGHAHPVIILDIDTLRADHLGCYGYQRDTSHWIDELASQGTVFEWAFAQAPNTPPSQASILTSLYPRTHGRVTGKDRLPEEVTTLAEVMQAGGFTTAAFVDGGYMAPHSGLSQGFETYHSSKEGLKGLAALGPFVFDWVRKNKEENFLLLIHTYDVHTPYDPPPPFREIFLNGLEPSTPGFEPDTKTMKGVMLRARQGELNQLTAADIEYSRALYDGGIRYVDAWIGSFMELLRENGLLERATIIVLSDHGEEFQEHGSVLHEKLYSTVTHIPLIIRPPGGMTARRVDQVVESIDLMPTILDMVGLDEPQTPMEGTSLFPFFKRRPVSRLEGLGPAFGESPLFGGRVFVADGTHQMLQTRTTEVLELFDFRLDSKEQDDISQQHPEVVGRLGSKIELFDQTSADTSKYLPGVRAIDDQDLEDLRALGYVE